MQRIEDYRDRIEQLQELWAILCEHQPLTVIVDQQPAQQGPRYWHLVHQDGSVEKLGIADSAEEALEDACWVFTDMVISQIRRNL
jgi:uncharacterized protein YceH (UPF0502 family)